MCESVLYIIINIVAAYVLCRRVYYGGVAVVSVVLSIENGKNRSK